MYAVYQPVPCHFRSMPNIDRNLDKLNTWNVYHENLISYNDHNWFLCGVRRGRRPELVIELVIEFRFLWKELDEQRIMKLG